MPVLSSLCALWVHSISSGFSPSDILYSFLPPSDMSYLLRGFMFWNFRFGHPGLLLCIYWWFRMVLWGLDFCVHQWVLLMYMLLRMMMIILSWFLWREEIELCHWCFLLPFLLHKLSIICIYLVQVKCTIPLLREFPINRVIPVFMYYDFCSNFLLVEFVVVKLAVKLCFGWKFWVDYWFLQ